MMKAEERRTEGGTDVYCALIVDLKDSRKYPPESRNELQAFLIETAEMLNEIFGLTPEGSLSFSGGDELQGLFPGADAAFLCLRLLRRIFFPIPLHAGLGLGEWTTVVPARNSYYQDGSAYHRAREAIDWAKRDTDNSALLMSGGEGDPGRNAMLNACFRLTEQNTAHQNQLSLLLEFLYPILPEGAGAEAARGLSRLPALMRKRDELEVFAGERGRIRESVFQSKTLAGPYGPPSERLERDGGRLCSPFAHPYGAASTVADAAGLTRQAVDTALRASNVYAERALAIALAETFSRTWEELRQKRPL